MASYFEKLSTPTDDPSYYEAFKQQVHLDFNLICEICSNLQDSVPKISCETVEKMIRPLKNNKACNDTGVSADHLKHGGKSVYL